jgi:hypothetical protein
MNVNNYWYAILQSTQVKLSKLLGVTRFGEKLIESDDRPIIEYSKMQARFEQQMSPYCNQINVENSTCLHH